ncbi:hypothetical protein [Kordiimonas gwangyangensis]|uniref:hypothetical protein n=2 Tax=Kordiimonas gwangyangensis TaxID=288022 RepID=UPI000360C34F|nr:hypothetical protein [Kordiimonas gwangyangensis]
MRYVLTVWTLLFAALLSGIVAADDAPMITYESVGRSFYAEQPEAGSKRLQDLAATIKAAAEDDGTLRQELIANKDELPPPILYLLAELTFPHDPAEAVQWYWLGHIRARLDAVLCADTTAAQGVLYLPGFARSVYAYTQANPKEAGEIGLQVMARDDLKASKASPMWICAHGVKAMNKAVQKHLGANPAIPAPKETPWLNEKEKVVELYAQILDGSREMFEKLTQPTDEQLTMKLMDAPTVPGTEGRNIRNVFWSLQDDILLIEEFKFTEPAHLLLATGDGVETLQTDLYASTFCLAGNFMSYQPNDEVKVQPYTHKGPRELRIKEGSFKGKGRIYSIEYSDRDVSRGGFHMRPAETPIFSRIGQSSLTCQWIKTPDDGNVPLNANYLMDLGDGRGYLESVDGGTYLHTSLDGKAVQISDTKFPLRCMKYVPFLDAIQMVACPQFYVGRNGDAINRDLMNVSLLRLTGGEPEIETRPFSEIPGERGATQTLLTKRGVVRLMPRRNTVVGDKPGGLYLLENNDWVKIWEGYPLTGDVSATGCKIAFTSVSHPNRMYQPKEVRTIDLCESWEER